MRDRARHRYGCRHAALTWLAILSLLVDALLPTALSAAVGTDLAAGATGTYCGAAPVRSGSDPVKHGQSGPYHCVFCLAAVSGLAPGNSPAMAAPRFAEIAAVNVVFAEAVVEPLFDAVAQPRGPPVAV